MDFIQWEASLGRLDANAAVMALASFRTEPIQGHLHRAKRLFFFI